MRISGVIKTDLLYANKMTGGEGGGGRERRGERIQESFRMRARCQKDQEYRSKTFSQAHPPSREEWETELIIYQA